ncbi:MAG: FAD-dependent oxidoreductase [Candidatus Eremiobacteraeota bacterium]|nr:FAD-dependent oxidoreductase [Candidatus Eremiobacteraeota bacterium]MCW5872571.1 FAD-dependent oxidoreductase [Candidatus Eremiobacteraeota bacterium]
MKTPVLIVGGGLAGLTCAVELERRGVEYRLLEAGARLGGRVVSDQVDGFILNRGFQVLLTGYPEIRRLWAMENLRLRRVRSGAVIRRQGKWLTLPDPLRHPGEIWDAWRSPVGTGMDKLRLALLALGSLRNSADNCFVGGSQTTLQYLQRWGFSEGMIETFWRPFLAGLFLDWELSSSADLFRFLLPLFAWGRVALPAGGMQQLPRQLERRLTPGRVVLETRVEKLEGARCWDQSGQLWEADQLVLALDGSSADRLLGRESEVRWAGSCTTYFAAPRSIGGRGRLHLNADGAHSCIQHLICISDFAPEYAPAGQHLISVSSLFARPSEDELRGQLQEWFGAEVGAWRMLRQDFLPQSLPTLAPGMRPRELKIGEGVWRCGDYTAYPSLNAAVASGRLVAESLGYGEPK